MLRINKAYKGDTASLVLCISSSVSFLLQEEGLGCSQTEGPFSETMEQLLVKPDLLLLTLATLLAINHALGTCINAP